MKTGIENISLRVLYFVILVFFVLALPLCLVGVRGYIWPDKYGDIQVEIGAWMGVVKELWSAVLTGEDLTA